MSENKQINASELVFRQDVPVVFEYAYIKKSMITVIQNFYHTCRNRYMFRLCRCRL